MKITDSPGAMLVMPFSGTAPAGDSELSSIFQPVMTAADAPMFVTSNQSAPTGLLPLDHGATSEMINGVRAGDAAGRADLVRIVGRGERAVDADDAQLREADVVQRRPSCRTSGTGRSVSAEA